MLLPVEVKLNTLRIVEIGFIVLIVGVRLSSKTMLRNPK
jgi:hypothetical protein